MLSSVPGAATVRIVFVVLKYKSMVTSRILDELSGMNHMVSATASHMTLLSLDSDGFQPPRAVGFASLL